MNAIQQGIILLLKSAISGEVCELPIEFKLEDASDLLKKHSIVPLVYVGALQCGISRTDNQMQKLFKIYGKNLFCNEKQMYDVGKIYEKFEKYGIDYMPVKGCNMKCLYPNPEMRVMGDADILIKMEQYPLVKKAMEELGFHFVLESNHDFAWESPNLFVELHYLLMKAYNKQYEDYFGNGWKLASKHEGHRYLMSNEDEFIYLFIHYTKHYRDGGIGCRHVVDLWVYLRSYPNMNFSYIEKIVTKLSVREFYDNTMKMINAWFYNGEFDEITKLMTDFIFSSGSWGTIKNSAMARGVKASQESGSSFKGKMKVIMDAVFPPLEDMKHRYGILKKAPYLLLVMWIWRWFDAVIFRRDNVKKYTKQVGSVCEGDISKYEKNLTAVGLDFTFSHSDSIKECNNIK